MTTALGGAVELLERSLAYTRGTLSAIRPELLDRATPCHGWALHRLLAHMEDALDAFIQASSGKVDLAPVPMCTGRVGALREKACVLLGAWSIAAGSSDDRFVAPPSRWPASNQPAPNQPASNQPASNWPVQIGERGVDATLLVATAALEIAVHGWDVGQATGASPPLPGPLARDLLPVARQVIERTDRGNRFAAPRSPGPGAGHGERLLAWTGRAA